MNLDEFREALSSDALIDNERLKAEHRRYKEECEIKLHKLREQNTHLRNIAKALANRCYVDTQGVLCMFCDIEKDICEHSISLDERIRLAKEFERSLKNETNE